MLVSSISALSELNPYPLTYGRKSERVASLSSTAAGLLRDSFKSSSGALNFKKSLRRQGIGFRRCFFQSFASAHSMSAVLRKTTEPVGSVHFRNVYLGRGSFIHASQALRPEKRGSPLPMGRTGTDSITLPLHCVRTRPAGKEVRLRLVLFNAHFILSGKCRPLRFRHILRGRTETRDCDSRCSAALHTVSHRLAERNRYVVTPLHLCRA